MDILTISDVKRDCAKKLQIFHIVLALTTCIICGPLNFAMIFGKWKW